MAGPLELPATFRDTRDALQRVAVHIVARARRQATGRFGLRVTPGGFGTPAFGDDVTRVRVSGPLLVRETAGIDGAASRAGPLDGATLAELAALAEVDLRAEISVGHDTPELDDVAAPLEVDPVAAGAVADWFGLVATALDRVVAAAAPGAAPTTVQLWPEHFDVALDLAASPGQRVNLGGSPGDGFHDEPYLYVGPWTDARPGEPGYWNAPFGAFVPRRDVLQSADPVAAAVEFYEVGISRFAE